MVKERLQGKWRGYQESPAAGSARRGAKSRKSLSLSLGLWKGRAPPTHHPTTQKPKGREQRWLKPQKWLYRVTPSSPSKY